MEMTWALGLGPPGPEGGLLASGTRGDEGRQECPTTETTLM